MLDVVIPAGAGVCCVWIPLVLLSCRLLGMFFPIGRLRLGGGSIILHEIRTALCDPNVERSLNTGIAPLILLRWRGDGVARPETSLDRSFALCYQPAGLGLEL
jgi:hypothetical protein